MRMVRGRIMIMEGGNNHEEIPLCVEALLSNLQVTQRHVRVPPSASPARSAFGTIRTDPSSLALARRPYSEVTSVSSVC